MLLILITSIVSLCFATNLCDKYCPVTLNEDKFFVCRHVCHDLAIEFSLINDLIDENMLLRNEVHFLNMLYLSYNDNSTFNETVKESQEGDPETDIIVFKPITSIEQHEHYCSDFYIIIYCVQFIWSILIIMFG